ncbi:efflux RND transporter permease subunit [Zymomonas mobilis]|uniref:Acriflavin resistance protein n=1 Tax=Zymomonas mobilis subsp. pomaceae (strain ATCC 29192 / DSM 22645 / JCM 10191 / CCUG 17912 / NBRC 13757 / NCIMB 11200 / NRRL B-4491 / Barker I) TaxID=579138 RepID=F8EW51_ZYMMT|nr:efflux RND transporter permease subunit [Zymomonas mobilis]AEI38461.1 acriflavin resistance protein [Zymomonas mobilis subsp. pomaceae ATCC 29192]MDX5948150.1 efflux RND transporter permease subunit [Zymomonas mobilis subsp. pomaceae]GEB89739.1 transport system membrane protein [Zymomonas mobilis subsp. pomaceae]
MNPSRLFILRPVATSLLVIAIVLAGLLGFRFMSLSALPEVDYPTIQVTTLYPGASPDVTSDTVTAPLERQFGQMSGLSRMTAKSSAGASVITLQFGLTEALDVAEQEVQAAINAANALLPADLPAPPVYAKVNPADSPVLTLAAISDTIPLTDVQNLIQTRLAQKISQVSGVGLVELSGGERPAMRIQADTQLLASYGISLATLRTAITNANANSAKGSFDGPTRSWQINANDQLLTVSDYENLIIAMQNNRPVRMRDVAQVVSGAENNRLGAYYNVTPAIIINVRRQPGANVIATVDTIKKRLPELEAGLPAGLKVSVVTDRTTGIRSSIEHVEVELVLAVIMVILVIFFFLHSIRATMIAALAVPISLIGSFAAMYMMNYSLNNLSLMALTIASGFVVDDAIVMIENIERHIEAGLQPFQAALKGAQEIGFTIISLTISLIAVLIPLLFMSDVVGRLFREFAMTLAITILISAVISLTLTPMLSARWLIPHRQQGGIGARIKQGFDRLEHHYEKGLTWVLAHQLLILILTISTFVATVLLYMAIPKGLFPLQATGQLRIQTDTSADISYERMAQLQKLAAQQVLEDPAVSNLSVMTGVDGVTNSALNQGVMLVNLKTTITDEQAVIARLYKAIARVAGIRAHIQPVQDLTVDTDTGPTRFRLSVEGAETNAVHKAARQIADSLAKSKKLNDVYTDADAKGEAVFVDIDRDSASRVSVTVADIDDTLYSAFGQRIVSTIFTETNQYRVILEARPNLLSSINALGHLNLPGSSTLPTPLDAFSTLREGAAPLQIIHVAQFPAAMVGFDLASNTALGDGVATVRAQIAALHLPAGITTTMLGAASAYEKALGNQMLLILAALVCVYIVLGVLYESYIHPLTILSTLPSASVGAILALWLTGHDLDIIGIIGIILLIGIVKKNAIMMIDFAIAAEREEGKSPEEAIFSAAILRFRPILMTTLAALFAAVPLMVGHGSGAELRLPLGLAIFGGLLASQLLTIFTTPVVYLVFDRLGQKVSALRKKKGTATA